TQWYEKAAAAGNPEAMVRLAKAAESEIGEANRCRSKEELKAQVEYWYRAAAAAGHVDAMSSLLRVNADSAEAERWLSQAFEAGEFAAGVFLARRLEDLGRKDEAAQWYRRAAEAGAPTAATSLASLLLSRGDTTGALHWCRRDADAGDSNAMWMLSAIYNRLG